MKVVTESHLGGHCGRTWIDEGVLKWFKHTFFPHLDYPSMLDIGCGPGGMCDVAGKHNFHWVGIDGDPEVTGHPLIMQCDFTKPVDVDHVIGDMKFDLAWSVEFLEHVKEQYQYNYMKVFQRCDFVVCTAAPPGWGGHHHVNEQPQDYWVGVFEDYGFEFLPELTKEMRKRSTMDTNSSGTSFMQNTGMFFKRSNL